MKYNHLSWCVASTWWLSVLCGSVAHAAGLRHRKLQADPSEIIPGQYLVELYPEYSAKKQASALTSLWKQNALASNGIATSAAADSMQIISTYDQALNGFALKNVNDDQLNALLSDPQVKAVWRVRYIAVVDDVEIYVVLLLMLLKQCCMDVMSFVITRLSGFLGWLCDTMTCTML
jgi:hypothetical protein